MNKTLLPILASAVALTASAQQQIPTNGNGLKEVTFTADGQRQILVETDRSTYEIYDNDFNHIQSLSFNMPYNERTTIRREYGPKPIMRRQYSNVYCNMDLTLEQARQHLTNEFGAFTTRQPSDISGIYFFFKGTTPLPADITTYGDIEQYLALNYTENLYATFREYDKAFDIYQYDSDYFAHDFDTNETILYNTTEENYGYFWPQVTYGNDLNVDCDTNDFISQKLFNNDNDYELLVSLLSTDNITNKWNDQVRYYNNSNDWVWVDGKITTETQSLSGVAAIKTDGTIAKKFMLPQGFTTNYLYVRIIRSSKTTYLTLDAPNENGQDYLLVYDINATAGIDAPLVQQMQVAPRIVSQGNPIQISGHGKKDITVTAINGQREMHLTANDITTAIPTSTLQRGPHILTVGTDGQTQSHKIVIK